MEDVIIVQLLGVADVEDDGVILLDAVTSDGEPISIQLDGLPAQHAVAVLRMRENVLAEINTRSIL